MATKRKPAAAAKPAKDLSPKKSVKGGGGVVLQGEQCLVFMLGGK
jgi:hypothetical protein